MPGRFALGSPFWYTLATEPIAIGATTSTVCHQGAIGCLRVSLAAIAVLGAIVLSPSCSSHSYDVGRYYHDSTRGWRRVNSLMLDISCDRPQDIAPWSKYGILG